MTNKMSSFSIHSDWLQPDWLPFRQLRSSVFTSDVALIRQRPNRFQEKREPNYFHFVLHFAGRLRRSWCCLRPRPLSVDAALARIPCCNFFALFEWKFLHFYCRRINYPAALFCVSHFILRLRHSEMRAHIFSVIRWIHTVRLSRLFWILFTILYNLRQSNHVEHATEWMNEWIAWIDSVYGLGSYVIQDNIMRGCCIQRTYRIHLWKIGRRKMNGAL